MERDLLCLLIFCPQITQMNTDFSISQIGANAATIFGLERMRCFFETGGWQSATKANLFVVRSGTGAKPFRPSFHFVVFAFFGIGIYCHSLLKLSLIDFSRSDI